MRFSLVVPMLLLALGSASADEVKPLSIGDPAPAIDIEHYFSGDAVTNFDKEKTYVIEFWATW